MDVRVSGIYFPAFTGRERRRLYVYLPKQYRKQPRRRFPVLYMFDGHNVFFDGDATYGKSWGMGSYLERHNIPLIVVAVECHHGAHGERICEYSPYDFELPDEWQEEPGGSSADAVGYGRETMEWFVNTLKPRIDRKYRTMRGREHTFLMGSSMGGLMSLYALLEFSGTYSKVCALSPALGLWEERLLDAAERADIKDGSELYMDYGCLEEDYPDAARSMNAIAGRLLDRGVSVTLRTIPGGHHCEASWERQLPFCISFLMYQKQDD